MDEQQKNEPQVPPSVPEEPPVNIVQQAPLEVPEVLPQTPATPPSLFTKPESSQQKNGDRNVTWTASGSNIYQKSASWYLVLLVSTIALACLLYFFTKSIVTPVVVIACGIIFGVYGNRRPDELEYTLDRQGIRIGSRHYLYDEFRLFVVTPDLPIHEVLLMPTKRFMPPLSVQYGADIENKVLGVLAEHLPFEERQPDLIDSLMHRMHF
jgi:hypothetical protein